MAIHHATRAKAEKLGIILTEEQDSDGAFVKAFYPQRNLDYRAAGAAEALDGVLKRITNAEREEYNAANPPAPLSVALEDHDPEMEPRFHHVERDEDEPEIARSESGIALDGAIAYKEGVMTADCPFDPESDDEAEQFRATAWYDAWDAAADAREEEDEAKGGSVVSATYRARYAEAGHPTHCGDWLAEKLVNLTTNPKGTNLELLEEIFALNNVDTSHLNRTSPGWQGRVRMTGRNLLARKVWETKQLILPETLGGVQDAPADWLAVQRFKSKNKGA